MKSLVSITGVVFVWMLFALSSCSVQDDKAVKPAAPPAPAPAGPRPKPHRRRRLRKRRKLLRWLVMSGFSMLKRTI